MQNIRIRGGAAVELALLVPFLSSLLIVVLNLSFFFLHQFRLEQLATQGARSLALSRLETAEELETFAGQWLLARGFSQVSPSVELHIVSTRPRLWPRAQTPVKIVQLKLLWEDRPAFPFLFPQSLTLNSLAHEVML